MASAAEFVAVPALSDNYIWLLHDWDSGHTAVVDPGDGAAALSAVAERGWTADQLLVTHWHPDHTAGVAQVKAASGAEVWAPAAERAKFVGFDHGLGEGDRVAVGRWTAEVWEVPGHTLGHIAYILPEIGVALVGDTLFACGCGRLFEGTPEQMFRSLQRLGELPGETLAYAAHEYTLSNVRFAAHVEPANAAVAERLRAVEAARAAGRVTLPTSIAEERATNPFLRAANPDEFAALRARKDSFR
uniref:hydroxyacylglutathione hydrolase n=1 Tax=uncultured Sphingomonas sp. TaxID=158754 RepID=UPI0025D26363|nr:hydroxyacylglutathione hydrolase [uncultured Sphingomonas sp.]